MKIITTENPKVVKFEKGAVNSDVLEHNISQSNRPAMHLDVNMA